MPKVDVAFRLTGRSIPADHGYLLYGAICEHVPTLHPPSDGEALGTPPSKPPIVAPLWRAIGIHPINGNLVGNRRLAVTGRSRLTLRVESDRIGEILPLAGKGLSLGADRLRVGVPEVHALKPVVRLRSRLVVIKGFLDPEPFLDAIRRQLEALGIRGTPSLLLRLGQTSLEGRSTGFPERSPFVRRTLRIRDKDVIGYSVEVSGLTAEESVRLQEAGVGGRRRFGCGIFVPVLEHTK